MDLRETRCAGGYGMILADPPWRFETYSALGRGRSPDGLITDPRKARNASRLNQPERHYATMHLEEIKALPVSQVADEHCVLMMWAVDAMLPEALDVGRAWGFEYKTVGFYWAKLRREGSWRGALLETWDRLFPMGTGYWTRSNPEQCLLFTRGQPQRLSASVRKLIVAPRREHSRKPEEQYKRLERLAPGPRLEMFARQSAPGWDAWGNEVTKFKGGKHA